MQINELSTLLHKFKGNELTSVEEEELFAYIADDSNEEAVQKVLYALQEEAAPGVIDRKEWEPLLQRIFSEGKKLRGEEVNGQWSMVNGESEEVNSQWSIVNGEKEEADSGESLVVSMKPKVQLWKRVAVAASVIGVLFVAGYFIVSRESSVVSPGEITVKTNDVQAPDKNRAQIKLADGTVLYLDSAANGELVNVNGVVVKKTEDGRIEYRESSVVSGELKYNTLFNPRGSKVMDMTLSDGSRVWLNAGSSITYPVAFIGNERKVSIDGEGYFEIAHDKLKPFKVSKGEMTVEVLGTHFNVNAYDDEENIKVTLLEGSVKVSNDVDNKVIKPGEQLVAVSHSRFTIDHSPDLDAVMAWKNGQFSFDNADLKTVMKQIARWYDVEIVYEGELPNEEFNGGTSRQENVSAVLKVLEATGKIKFKVEGKKVVVSR